VKAREAATTARQQTSRLGQMGGFVTRHRGQRLDPARTPAARPPRHELHGVEGGFLFEEHVIGKQFEGFRQNGITPCQRSAGMERKAGGLLHGGGCHLFKVTPGPDYFRFRN
jgi:hypothetical protein